MSQDDVLARLVFSEKYVMFYKPLGHLSVLASQWSFLVKSDYSYRTLWNIFTHLSEIYPFYSDSLISIVVGKKDVSLLRHFMASDSKQSLSDSTLMKGILKCCIDEMFDEVFDRFMLQSHSSLYGGIKGELTRVLQYAMSIDINFRERRPMMIEMIKTGQIENHMELLTIVIRRKDAELVEMILSTEHTLGADEHRKLEKLTKRYFHQSEWKDVLTRIQKGFESYERNDHALWLCEEKVFFEGTVEYEDILYIVRCIQKQNLSQKYKDMGRLLDPSLKEVIVKYLSIIPYHHSMRDSSTKYYDIMTKSGIDRLVIYKLCNLFNIKYERIDEHYEDWRERDRIEKVGVTVYFQ